jgi:tRNA A58 N-methylase Trm61
MGSFIARQPNGKLCVFSTIVDCPTEWNMTEEEYIQFCIDKAVKSAKKEAKMVLKKYIRPFDEVVEHTQFINMTKESFAEFLEEVGY